MVGLPAAPNPRSEHADAVDHGCAVRADFAWVIAPLSWTNPDDIPDDELHHFKQVWLTPGNFTLRAMIYFVLLLGIVYLLNRRSIAQDHTGDPAQQAKLTAMSGLGLMAWGFLVSLAAFDWVMSLEPHWFSTIYGLIFM